MCVNIHRCHCCISCPQHTLLNKQTSSPFIERSEWGPQLKKVNSKLVDKEHVWVYFQNVISATLLCRLDLRAYQGKKALDNYISSVLHSCHSRTIDSYYRPAEYKGLVRWTATWLEVMGLFTGTNACDGDMNGWRDVAAMRHVFFQQQFAPSNGWQSNDKWANHFMVKAIYLFCETDISPFMCSIKPLNF